MQNKNNAFRGDTTIGGGSGGSDGGERQNRGSAIQYAMDRLENSVYNLEELLGTMKGESTTPMSRQPTEVTPTIPISNIIADTPEAIDRLGDRINNAVSSIKDIVI